MREWRATYRMQVWQVFHCHSVDLHPRADAVVVQVDIAARAQIKNRCGFVSGEIRLVFFFCAHLHVGDLNVDVVLVELVSL